MRRHQKKIVFLIPYPVGEAPSQRFRFEQYLSLLENHQFKITLLPFLDQWAWENLYTKDNHLLKMIHIIRSWAKRFFQITHLSGADFVFVHRETAPLGPPLFEWVIAKIMNKKLIYDFDDAIWLSDNTNEPFFAKFIRWRSKVASICKWSYRISCGNDYLCSYASRFNSNVIKNPTTIDTVLVHNPLRYYVQKNTDRIVIGWTGSHSTLKYLYLLESVLQQIHSKYDEVDFMVIADKPPALNIKRLIFKPWSKETEIADLLLADIGIMPLPDDEWTKGKCGFKALQYMSLMIPPVVSPVGVNRSIIQHGITGFLCNTEDEWVETFDLLIRDNKLREEVGRAGFKTVNDQFSVASNSANFLSLFE